MRRKPFDAVRLDLGDAFIAALASDAPIAGEMIARLDKARQEHLIDGLGVLILTGFERLDGPALIAAFRNASELFGTLLPQNASGEIVREVRDRGTRIGEGRTTRYSDSRFGGSLHTDGAEAPHPVPDYFTLLCVRAAATGGALQLVHVRDVERQLADRADILATLRAPVHFDRRGDEAPGELPTTRKAILFDDNGQTGVTYLREYVELGHARDGVPDLTAAQVAALDALDAVLTAPDIVVEDTMRPGDFALFNNRRLLHGRTEFTDPADPERGRLLYRTWIRKGA